MKKLIGVLAAVVISANFSYGQGALVFVNRVVGLFDSPVHIFGTDQGAGTLGPVEAQLWTAGPSGELLASTTFRGSEGNLARYLLPVDVIIEGNGGTPVDLQIKFFLHGNPISSDSGVFTAIPGVPPNPPGNLTGLAGLQLTVVPEPSVIALAVLGAGALLFRRRK